jgi:NAD(P)-dependent dehydrogenase (short-subunit alcohol dehydrogenase family)
LIVSGGIRPGDVHSLHTLIVVEVFFKKGRENTEKMASVLITGSSRGLGLALVKQLLTLPSTTIGTIYATSRAASPPDALSKLINSSHDRLKHVQLDVTDSSSISAAAAKVSQLSAGKGLDILINNAGTQSERPGKTSTLTASDLEFTFMTNVMGVHLVTAAFLPLLKTAQTKKIVNISSTLGSIGWSDKSDIAPVPAYKISKAALNMLTVQYASELARQNFTVFAISPGWLQTDLGGGYAHLRPEVGAREVVRIVLEATPQKDNGVFRDICVEGFGGTYSGVNPPW